MYTGHKIHDLKGQRLIVSFVIIGRFRPAVVEGRFRPPVGSAWLTSTCMGLHWHKLVLSKDQHSWVCALCLGPGENATAQHLFYPPAIEREREEESS